MNVTLQASSPVLTNNILLCDEDESDPLLVVSHGTEDNDDVQPRHHGEQPVCLHALYEDRSVRQDWLNGRIIILVYIDILKR